MEYQVYKVGGAVRDELLGRSVKDIDWVVVGATPDLLLSKGYLQVGKDFPVFLHPETKEEYALARTERKHGHGYGGFAVFATPDVTLEEDLLRRDLTINAMAMDDHGFIIDPYHGKQDLDNRVLRHVSDAFAEDPLRVLRLARFYARFYDEGFSVADDTREIIKLMIASGELEHLVPERIWLETQKALMEKNAVQYFMLLHELGALKVVFPLLDSHFIDLNETRFVTILNALSNAIERNEIMSIRVALLLQVLSDVKEIKAFAEQYRLSAQEKVLAEKLAQWETNFWSLDNEDEWLNILLGLDAFRKPDQLMQFLKCIEILSVSFNKEKLFFVRQFKLLEIHQKLIEVDVKQLIKNVLPQEIPQALKAERLRIIKSLIKE